MGDFGQVRAASLWKSGPFFSTGTSEAELMKHRASVEPAVGLDATPGGVAGGGAGEGWNGFGPKLSTAFAEPGRLPSPEMGVSVHSADDRNERRPVVRRRKEA